MLLRWFLSSNGRYLHPVRIGQRLPNFRRLIWSFLAILVCAGSVAATAWVAEAAMPVVKAVGSPSVGDSTLTESWVFDPGVGLWGFWRWNATEQKWELVSSAPPSPAENLEERAQPRQASRPSGSISDRRSASFTDSAGTSSTYHLMNAEGATQLWVYLDGDDMHAIKYPDEDVLGGADGLAARAAEHGAAVLAPMVPDGSQGDWWRQMGRNGKFITDLTRSVADEIGVSTISWGAFSGGSQVLTKEVLRNAGDLCTGRAVITGGGGAPDNLSTPPSCPLEWITGTADIERQYNAIDDAKEGAAFYASRGANVSTTHPEGMTHTQIRRLLPEYIADSLGATQPR